MRSELVVQFKTAQAAGIDLCCRIIKGGAASDASTDLLPVCVPTPSRT